MRISLKPAAMSFPAPVYIVGTYNEDGTADAMNAAWGGVCASAPPCIQISLNTGRRTRENILRTGCFTVSFAVRELMQVSDYFGLISGTLEDKVARAGITVEKSALVDAPILCQYPLTLECRLYDSREIGPHLMVIGEIVGISADERILDADGRISVEKLDPLALDPVGHRYLACHEIIGEAFEAGKELLSRR